MIAFHGKHELKSEHMDWLLADIAKDRLIAGSFGERANGGWRGCQWGCFMRSHSPHEIVEAEVGIPRIVSRLSDGIFEGLSAHDAEAGRAFAVRFFEVIEVGADLSLVWPKWLLWLMIDPEHGVTRHAKTDRTRERIDKAVELLNQVIAGAVISRSERRSAYAAAAAYAAAYADADAAAADAAAYAAAYAAAAAAYADARGSHWQWIATRTIHHLTNAPINVAMVVA